MAAYPYLLLRSHNYLSQHLSHVEVLHYKAYIYFHLVASRACSDISTEKFSLLLEIYDTIQGA